MESPFTQRTVSLRVWPTMVYENGMGVLPIFYSASSLEHRLPFDFAELWNLNQYSIPICHCSGREERGLLMG